MKSHCPGHMWLRWRKREPGRLFETLSLLWQLQRQNALFIFPQVPGRGRVLGLLCPLEHSNRRTELLKECQDTRGISADDPSLPNTQTRLSVVRKIRREYALSIRGKGHR